jgi:hypothetical protein
MQNADTVDYPPMLISLTDIYQEACGKCEYMLLLNGCGRSAFHLVSPC